MSYVLTQLTQCPDIQQEINNVFCNTQVTEQFPLFEFLASSFNDCGLKQQISPGGGKVKTIQVVYTPRISEDDVTENASNPNCSASNQYGDRYQDYTIDTDENVQSNEYIDPVDLERICKENSTFIFERLNAHIDAVDRKLATKHTQDAVLLAGKWASNVSVNGSDEFEVKTLKTGSTDEVYPFTMQEISRAARETGYINGYAIFGDYALADYYERTLAACCTTDGIDLSGLLSRFGVAVAYDRRVANSLGSNKSLLLQPGNLALINFTRSSWSQGIPPTIINMGNEQFFTIVSPRTGVPMDVMIKLDCGKINITVTATTKLVGLPSDRFVTGDIFEGVVGVNKIKVANS